MVLQRIREGIGSATCVLVTMVASRMQHNLAMSIVTQTVLNNTTLKSATRQAGCFNLAHAQRSIEQYSAMME